MPETLISVLAAAWFAEQLKKERSPNTTAAYRRCVDAHILPALGSLRIRQLTVGTVDRFVTAVATKTGPASAKQTKAALSGMCTMATRLDALDRNIVGEHLCPTGAGRRSG